VKIRACLSLWKKLAQKLRYFGKFPTTAKSEQSPKRRKFAQSDHLECIASDALLSFSK
jgi:hypothetical protein